jgi:hypothetical protein
MFMNKVSCSDFSGHQKFIKKHRREEFHIITKIQDFIFIDSSITSHTRDMKKYILFYRLSRTISHDFSYAMFIKTFAVDAIE